MSTTPVGDYLAKRYPPNDGATHAMGDERNPLGCMAWHNPCLYHAAFREGAAAERERIRDAVAGRADGRHDDWLRSVLSLIGDD